MKIYICIISCHYLFVFYYYSNLYELAFKSLHVFFYYYIVKLKEEFEDTKGVIIIRISKKNRQHNGQNKKYKRTNNDLQNIQIKLKIELREPH